MIEINKFNNKVQEIQDDLNKVKEMVLSEAKREEKIEEIKGRAKVVKEELEAQITTLKDKTQEEAQSLLGSLNEVINFKFSIGDKNKARDEAMEKAKESGEEIVEGGKKAFDRVKDWVGDQRESVWEGKWTFDVEGGKNLLRAVGFAATGIGAGALVYKGVKKLWNWAFGKKEKTKSETESTEKKGFGKKLLKWGGIASAFYLLWEYLMPNKSKEKIASILNGNKDSEDAGEGNNGGKPAEDAGEGNNGKTPEEDTGEGNNGKTPEEDTGEGNNGGKPAEDAGEGNNGGKPAEDAGEGNNGETPGRKPETSPKPKVEEVKETRIPIDASTVTNAAIKYIKGQAEIEVLGKNISLLGNKTESKVKKIFNDYLKRYPLLRKSNKGKMKFEIGSKKEFANMTKNLRTTMIDGLPTLAKPVFKATDIYKKADNILSDINKNLPNSDADDYKKIVFTYVGGVVKEVVKNEGGKMTLEDYYNDISTYYPNKNATQISKNLLSSGDAKKNINEVNYA